MATINIVIIGASTVGLTAAHDLLRDAQILNAKVTLINPSATFYWNIAAPRIIAKPKAFRAEEYLLPIKEAFAQYATESFEFILGTVTEMDISNNTVSVTPNDGDVKSVAYDHLLIGSGATTPATVGQVTGYSFPFKHTGRDDMKESLEAAQNLTTNAKSIVIGGAGPVGVELAGELAEAAAENSSDLSITLVSATDRILHTLKSSASSTAENQLKKKGVNVITSTRVMAIEASGDSWVVSLDSGEKITTDIYIPTTGFIPNNSFIPEPLLATEGWVRVDKELRVQSSENSSVLPIYAAGDITTNWMRLGFKAAEQARVAAHNIKADILRKADRKTYDQGESINMVVPVGGTGGSGQIFGFVPFNFLVRMIKGKDFLISKAAVTVAGKA
ncbi:FAD-dependent pyridine nucleotide-disulfide oxidoreductase [Penicillium verhagenii]|uniref:FAD-dependent pyridine nucleotide-disulfide oxidoreductase n=1 Tax=Penicillium verhagenii TaxID=1562060 RepID=UPI002544D778|nr:FAD-dependent pyridine nucleotide-disulfide oxidoreductase [Penicillium verhagenii]KAJ5948207.1 FAD-dependent pyridine nucleotide-disulfide oxidoreductase [Penicillium verhagenii]